MDERTVENQDTAAEPEQGSTRKAGLFEAITPRKWLLLGLAAVLTIGTAYLIVFKFVDVIVAGIPYRWEERIGRTLVRTTLRTLTFQRNARMCRNPAGVRVLQRLTRRLAATMDTPYRFHVRVADSGMVNAFAAPGGHIVILRGLIDEAKSPEEVAGILAHEMGHAVKRHSLRRLVRVLGVTVLWGGAAGNFLVYSGVYSHKAEYAADRLAVAMLNRSGIRGGPFSGFFARMHAKGKGASVWNKYVGTHPPSLERANAVKVLATGNGPAMSWADWLALKRICR